MEKVIEKEKLTLRELLEEFHGRLLDLTTVVHHNDQQYHITSISYVSSKGLKFVCDKEEDEKVTLREILEILHYKNLEDHICVEIENQSIDITELIEINNSLLVIKC